MEAAGGLAEGTGSPGAGVEGAAALWLQKTSRKTCYPGGWEGKGHSHHYSMVGWAGEREGCLLLGPLSLAESLSSGVGGCPLSSLRPPESPTRALEPLLGTWPEGQQSPSLPWFLSLLEAVTFSQTLPGGQFPITISQSSAVS